MKKNKGVSMISLVIIIVVTVILIGIATTAGYRYIIEGNRLKGEAAVSIISEAAYRRQNDLSYGLDVAYYEGYSFDVEKNAETKYKKIEGIPLDDENTNNIPDCLEKPGAKWYLFDAESANALGVKESDKLITRNISYIPAIKEKEIKLVLADYSTGEGYLVNFPKDILNDSIRHEGGCLNSPDGNHDYKIIATCTKPATCIYCGQADPLNPALGHDFSAPTCIASGICKRCGAVDPDHGPLGHLMISNDDVDDPDLIQKMLERNLTMYSNDKGPINSVTTPAWITDALKHWHECSRCGMKSEEHEHTKGYVEFDSEYHYQMCSICGWQSIKTKHEFVYESITANTHKKKCKICNYEEIHNDSGWLPTHPDYHYRICDEVPKCTDSTIVINGKTEKVLFKEKHYDLDHDLYCDICGRSLDKTPPIDFGTDENHYAKVIKTTTSSITVEAFTEDEGNGLGYYEFGIIDLNTGKIVWKEKIVPTSQSSSVQYTFDNLKNNTEYDIYVRATDKVENKTKPYKIPKTKTDDFPKVNGLTNIPDHYVQGPIKAGIAPIETTLTNIDISYSIDNGKTWNTTNIKNLSNIEIILTKEIEEVQIKITDDANPKNESGIWKYKVEKIDKTPPTIIIQEKENDSASKLKRQHYAKVIINDEKSGIAPNTEVHYAWSTDNSTAPTEYQVLKTENIETVSRVAFEVSTPENVDGNYYLWVLKGTKDAVGNSTIVDVCSEFYFKVDDVDVVVKNIKMSNRAPIITNEFLFVRTNGWVTISFETDKKLGAKAEVKLNGYPLEIQTTDGLNHVGIIKVTDKFIEGKLEISIKNIVSETGRINNKEYTNKDLVEGPVIYDKTLPKFEYVPKKK